MDNENEPRKYVHIFIMQGVTKTIIDELVEDLRHAYGKNVVLEQERVVEQCIPVASINEDTDIQRVAHVPLDNRGYSGN
jgi:hypothetical protein